MSLLLTESAIGLYAYGQFVPQASLFARYYSLVVNELLKVGVKPTYIGLRGQGFSGKYSKFDSSTHKRVIDENFEKIEGLSLAANPIGSSAPAYDSFFEGHLSFRRSGFPDSPGQVADLSFVSNESLLPFASKEFERVLLELVNLRPWDFGMGFSDTVDRHPELHIACLGHDKLSPEETEAGNIWYNTPPEVRVQKLRSIYPYNIVNERQLAQQVETGVSLKQLISELQIGTLEPLEQNGLYLWKVLVESERKSLRDRLRQQSLVVA
jgi:hypothetical protein